MNNKGFTLVELLAVLVILALVVGMTLTTVNFNFGKAKEKTEEVFVDTIRDAVEMYLSTESDNLKLIEDILYDGDGNIIEERFVECNNKLKKEYNDESRVFLVEKRGDSDNILWINFSDIINSSYKPLTLEEFINPANEEQCKTDAEIKVYRDEDYVYYYWIKKRELGCLNNVGTVKETLDDGSEVKYSKVITNLPEGYSCDPPEGYDS